MNHVHNPPQPTLTSARQWHAQLGKVEQVCGTGGLCGAPASADEWLSASIAEATDDFGAIDASLPGRQPWHYLGAGSINELAAIYGPLRLAGCGALTTFNDLATSG